MIALEHRDGSSTLTTGSDGEPMPFDKKAAVGKGPPYVWGRRRQIEHRVREVEAVLAAVHGGKVPAVGHVLDPDCITLQGHSFGGATVLTVIARLQGQQQQQQQTRQQQPSPPSVASCIVHDPAIDWMPDDARIALLGTDPEDTISPADPSGRSDGNDGASGTARASGGLRVPSAAAAAARFKRVPTMHVFSATWARWNYAGYNRVKRNLASGWYGDGSVFCALRGTAHFSFTDMNFLIPGPLARVLYFAGDAPPAEVLAVLRRITQPFLAEHWKDPDAVPASAVAALQAEASVFDLVATGAFA